MARVNLLLLFALLLPAIGTLAQSGIRWSDPTNIAASSFGNQHPRIAFDRLNNPLVIWGRASDESVFFARRDGQTFTEPIKLSGSYKIASASWMGPQIASHGDTLYVVMKQTPENSSNSHIYIVRSEDAGKTFSAPVRVDYIADSISRFPTVTCDSNGNPIVAFMKFDPGFRNSRWVVAASTDLGRTFSKDVKASGWDGANDVCDCCPGAMVSDQSTTAMLYRNNNNDIRDIWMGVSQDNGLSFVKGLNVDNSNWEIPNCPATGPDAVIVGDTLYTVFCSAPEGYNRTFLSRSSMKNNEHHETVRLPQGPTGASQQNYPRIASFGSAVGIVWKQNVMGVAQLPLLFSNDVSRGFPDDFDTVDVGDVTSTDIAIGRESIAVCWEDPNTRTVVIRVGRFSLNPTSAADDIMRTSLTVYPNPSTDQLTVHSDLPVGTSIYLVNMLSQVCIHTTTSGQSTLIDIGLLSNGIYTVCLASATELRCQDIVVHR